MKIRDLIRARFGNVHFFADGDGGGGGGGETPPWHADFPCLADNPESSKAMAKYGDTNAALEAAVDAQKKVGRAYWLPDDHSKLTDAQKAEIRANVAVMENVPDTADGYKLTVAEGTKSVVDEQGMAEFKVFCKNENIPLELAQRLLNLQNSVTDRVSALINKTEDQAIKDRNVKNAELFSTDCGGEAQALMRREMIKGLLQSKCTNTDGEPDPEMWEKFEKQFDEKGIDLPLLRALSEPALAASNAGTLPGGGGKTPEKTSEHYAEMKE